MKSCLDPIISDASRVLILGTLPGDESLWQPQYANARNQLWIILGAVFQESLSAEYNERVRFLHRQGAGVVRPAVDGHVC